MLLVQTKQKVIPTPEIKIVADYDATTPNWMRPNNIIVYTNKTFEEDPIHDYDIDSEDEVFLKTSQIPSLSEPLFEKVLDWLEKNSFHVNRLFRD